MTLGALAANDEGLVIFRPVVGFELEGAARKSRPQKHNSQIIIKRLAFCASARLRQDVDFAGLPRRDAP